MENDTSVKAAFLNPSLCPLPSQALCCLHFGIAHNCYPIFTTMDILPETFRRVSLNLYQTVLALETWLGIFNFTRTKKAGGSYVTSIQRNPVKEIKAEPSIGKNDPKIKYVKIRKIITMKNRFENYIINKITIHSKSHKKGESNDLNKKFRNKKCILYDH
ncbi:MAG: hypothetical protein WAX69_16905 [Victivallales bacterium]